MEPAKAYVLYAAPTLNAALISESPTDRVGLLRRGEDPRWLSEEQIWRYQTFTSDGNALILSSEVGGWDDDAVDEAPELWPDPATTPALQPGPGDVKYRVLLAGALDSYVVAARGAAGDARITLIEQGQQVADLALSARDVAWSAFADHDGGLAFNRGQARTAHKIIWTGSRWHTETISVPAPTMHIFGSAHSDTYYLLAEGSARTLTDGQVSDVSTALAGVTQWYPTSTGYLLAGRRHSSRTGLHFELEYHNFRSQPLWRVAMAGEIGVSTSTTSREFYLTGQGPVRRFNDRGADGLLEPSIAAVAFTNTGQLVYLDTSGRLL